MVIVATIAQLKEELHIDVKNIGKSQVKSSNISKKAMYNHYIHIMIRYLIGPLTL